MLFLFNLFPPSLPKTWHSMALRLMLVTHMEMANLIIRWISKLLCVFVILSFSFFIEFIDLLVLWQIPLDDRILMYINYIFWVIYLLSYLKYYIIFNHAYLFTLNTCTTDIISNISNYNRCGCVSVVFSVCVDNYLGFNSEVIINEMTLTLISMLLIHLSSMA